MAKKIDPNQGNMFVRDTNPYRYLIVLNVGFEINYKVKQLKEHLNILYPGVANMKSVPHITLAYKDTDYRADEFIIEKCEEAVRNLGNFEIKINGFDHWENNNVFFLKLKDQGPVYKLMHNMQHQLSVSQGKTPHLTLAKLSKKQYGNISFESFHYEAAFICNSMTILRKKLDNPDEDSVEVKRIRF